MNLIWFAVCLWATFCCGRSAAQHDFPVQDLTLSPDFHGESGDDLDCHVNLTHLEEMIQNAVDSRLEELKSHLMTSYDHQSKLRHVKHRAHVQHHFHEQRKEKLKSLEFRMLKLSKELEITKLTLNKQTEALEHSLRLSKTHQTATKDISVKHTELEDTVASLADRMATLGRVLKLGPEKFPNQIPRIDTSTNAPDVRPTSYPKDCSDVYRDMSMLFHGDFFITIKPEGSSKPFTALCKVFNNKAWTVIQRRFNGSVDFYRNWSEYKAGFGRAEGEFWIGNENIHHLTKNGQMSLRIEMEDWEGVKYYAEYDQFRIANEDELFRLHAKGYHGDAGDSLTSRWESHNEQAFSTHDRDNDARFYDNCSEHYHGAWWFNSCFTSHLNGKYFVKENHKKYFIRNGIRWNTLHMYASLKSTLMMISPRVNSDS